MKSFRLHVGHNRYLTGAGWMSLLLAVIATAAIGILQAAWLYDTFGPVSVSRVVAGCGLAFWLLAWLLFRWAGFPLIAKLPEEP